MPEPKCQTCDVCGSAGKGQEWISVEERLPSGDQDHYLVACLWNGDKGKMTNHQSWVSTHFWDGKRFLVTDDYSVTHWMPLPEPPKPQNPFYVLPNRKYEQVSYDVCSRLGSWVCSFDDRIKANCVCVALNEAWRTVNTVWKAEMGSTKET